VSLGRSWEVKPLEFDLARAVSDEDYVLAASPSSAARVRARDARGMWSLYAPAAGVERERGEAAALTS